MNFVVANQETMGYQQEHAILGLMLLTACLCINNFWKQFGRIQIFGVLILKVNNRVDYYIF